MDGAIRWLRISYWTGAIADAAVAVLMLSPKLYARGLGLAAFAPGDDYRHAMGMGAALMLGWTGLLLWANRRPLERRGILPLTARHARGGCPKVSAAPAGTGSRTGFPWDPAA